MPNVRRAPLRPWVAWRHVGFWFRNRGGYRLFLVHHLRSDSLNTELKS
jgi:hypothetical protein